MAGPAIRAWHMAEVLSREHEVRLVTTGDASLEHPDFAVTAGGDRELRAAMAWCDIFIFQGWILAGRPFLTAAEKILVADIYDPMHLEQLEQGREAGTVEGHVRAVADATAVLNEQLARGDFFMCASRKQRDFWLGQLAALGRINPATYEDDATLAKLLAIVPFGAPDDPPVATAPAAKGVMQGIGVDDRLVVWGGGIYNWLDPLTLIRAIDRVRDTVPNVRLLFLGLRHPNPEIPEMRTAVEAQRLASELGLTGTHVFFNEGWVPYRERQNYLIEADIGVSMHLEHLETEFSYRTRVIDYFWARLPVVATVGDSIAELIVARGLGVTVPPADEAALASAIVALLTDEKLAADCRTRVDEFAQTIGWSSTLRPLLEFCRDPKRAPDLVDPIVAPMVHLHTGVGPRTGWRRDVDVLRTYLAQGGLRLVARRVLARLARIARTLLRSPQRPSH